MDTSFVRRRTGPEMLLVRDIPMASAIVEMHGKNDRGGSMHLFDNAARFYGGNTIVAGNLNLAVTLTVYL